MYLYRRCSNHSDLSSDVCLLFLVLLFLLLSDILKFELHAIALLKLHLLYGEVGAAGAETTNLINTNK